MPLDLSWYVPALLPALLAGLVALGIFRRQVLRPLAADLPLLARSRLRKMLEGAGLALALLLVVVAPPLLAGQFDPSRPGWKPFMYELAGGALGPPALFLVLFPLQSLLEELAYRAFLLSLLTMIVWAVLGRVARLRPSTAAPEDFRRRRSRVYFAAGLAANVLQAWAFGELHRSNPHATPLAVVNVGLAGAVLGALFLSDGTLYGPFSFHATWNTGLALLGLPVSGMALARPAFGIAFTGAVPGALTGGAFGPEGSAVATVSLAALFLVLVARDALSSPIMNGGRQKFTCAKCGKVFVYWVLADNPFPKVKCSFCATEAFPRGAPPPPPAVAATPAAPAQATPAAKASEPGPAPPVQ
jgi:membrane protease YdiL (CAAX protease family)